MQTNSGNKSFADTLPTRSKNCLACCFGRDVLTKPEIIVKAGMKRLRLAEGVGPKSLREITVVLYEFCYIDNIDEWLES